MFLNTVYARLCELNEGVDEHGDSRRDQLDDWLTGAAEEQARLERALREA